MTGTARVPGHMGTARPATITVAPRTTRTKWPTAISKKTTATINEKAFRLMVSYIHFRE
jgi:hypothetical protein